MRKKKEIEVISENILNRPLDELMGEKFAIYAKDVIQDRAIPDARDGLKPVQRRILFGMWNTGNTIDKPTKKCAHIVGDVMGKYHPHGDSSIYEALVHMSQTWAFRYPLIDFQGNNGSIDGDGPAAYRYTEARLSAISNELLDDLEYDTVDMELTFDDTLLEPSVLPAHFPALLCNGSQGIAVGISTNIPPHNLREVCEATIYRIKNPNCTIDDLLNIMPGPDFPTGGTIFKSDSLRDIYLTGRGKVTISSKYQVIDTEKEKAIIVTEIPYQVNKSALVKSIDKIRHDKTIPGIEEVRDESDKSGLRIAIELKNDSKPEAILNYLLNKTALKVSYSAQMVAIIDDRPKEMDLLTYLDSYINHQLEVMTRKTRFLLTKNEERLNIVVGLLKAVSILDDLIKTIRASENKKDCKDQIMIKYGFNEPQAEAIVMMPLYKLSHTDVLTLENEKESLEKTINRLNHLLKSQDAREQEIIKQLERISKTYGDDRRTDVQEEEATVNLDKRDFIQKEDVYVVLTKDGYIKRSSLKSFKGSGGHTGSKPGIKNGDVFIYLGKLSTTDYLIVFTSNGNYVFIPVNEIRETKWNDEGVHINSLVTLANEEKIVYAFGCNAFRDDLYTVLLSEKGFVKRVMVKSYEIQRRSKALTAMKLNQDDRLVGVTVTTGNSVLAIFSDQGDVALYNENEITVTSTKSGGMKAGPFKGKPLVGVLNFAPGEKTKFLLVTDRGALRVDDIDRLTVTHRLNKVTPLYKMFKQEPHRLIFVDKVGDKEEPYTFEGLLNDDERLDITFPDFHLTPQDKCVKRMVEVLPKASMRIKAISPEYHLLINSLTRSYQPPVMEESSNENTEDGDAFSQISLFDFEEK